MGKGGLGSCEEGGLGTPRVWGSRKPPYTYTPWLGTPPVQPRYPFGQGLPRAHQQQDPPGGLQSRPPPQFCSTPELLALAGGSPAPPQALLNLSLQTG